MQIGHRQVQQPEVFGSHQVSWPASWEEEEQARGGLVVAAPEKLDRLLSDLAFESFPGNILCTSF